MSTGEVVRQDGVAAGALVKREDFGGRDLATVTEHSQAAVTARETALIQARCILAMQRPRRINEVADKLVEACKIWDFADEAWYARPAGKEFNEETGEWEEKIAEGFSIRFAEESGRTMGNTMSSSHIISETPEERVVSVWAMDLETNFTRSIEISIPKLVERKTVKDHHVVVAERLNSKGKKVFTVRASMVELNQTQANLVAKAERQCILKMLPAWIQKRCKDQIQETFSKAIKENRDREMAKLLKAFDAIKITPTDLQAYLGKSLDKASDEDIKQLTNLGRAIKQGEITWDEAMEAKDPVGGTREDQERVAQEKIARLEREKAEREQKQGSGQPLTEEEMRAADKANQERDQQQPGESKKGGFNFGRPKQ